MKTIFRSLTRKLILMGIVMVIAIGIFIAATYVFTQDIKGDATRINHAGRLRYRSFEMAWLASTIIEAKDIASRTPFLAELNLDMERFDRIITDLKDGSKELGIGPMEYEEALAALKAISDEWNESMKPMLTDMSRLPREKAILIFEIYNKRIEGYVYEKVDRLVSVLENASKKKLRDFNIFRLYSFGFFAIATVFVIFYARRNIVMPVRRLRDAIKEVEKGNFDIQAPVAIARDRGDEIILLTHTFNDMVRALKIQIDETGMLLKSLDNKNKELLDANKALQSSKEQIEVAYEEAQTQSEELESANEELRILNEDLDRKTRELLDVNKLLKIEEETAGRISNELQSIFDGIQDEIVLFDLDYNIVKANKAFMEGLHLQPRDLAEKKCFNLLRNRDSVCDVCVVRDTYKTARPAFMEERTADEKIMQQYTFPVMDKGKLTGVVEYIKEVTDQRLLEQQLIQAEKLTSIGEMLSGVAHELNNPLTGILGFSELLMEKKPSAAISSYISKINQEALRCKKIVQGLLNFARRHKPEKVSVNINELIYQIMELREYDLQVSNIKVTTNLDKDIQMTIADPYQLQQVFLNIINNAQQAMLEDKDEGRLSIKTLNENNIIRIIIKDSGPGIAPENLNRIFDPFFTTKGVGKGTGLGLSVAYGIIKEQGGKIYAESKPGKGAKFIIELPVVKEKEVIEEKERPAEAAQTTKKAAGIKAAKKANILAVDDEPVILDLIKEILCNDGHTVDTTTSANDALKMIKEKRYDLLISDVKMPEMTGIELIKKVKKIDSELAKRVVVSTGDSSAAEAENKEIKTYLLKPFTVDGLKRAIANVLKEKR